MFSSDTKDMMKFKFHVYDLEDKGTITVEDMFKVAKSFIKVYLDIMEKEKSDLELEKFAKGRNILEGEKGDKQLKEIVLWAFDAADKKNEGKMSRDEFDRAFKKNEELFDWKAMFDALIDELRNEVENLI